MDQMKLKEIQYSPLACQISSNHCCSWSEDNSLAALTKSGILVVDFFLNSLKLLSTIPTRQTVIEACSSLPTNQFHDQIEKIIPELHRDELHQMILDKNLYPKFAKTETFVPTCKQFTWSPRGLNHLHRCLIAVVTDAGSCNIYVRGELGFNLHKSISDDWVNICTKSWSNCNIFGFVDLCSKVKKIDVEVIDWSHAVGSWTKKAALLVCVHKNFEITLWRIETMAHNLKPPENVYLDILTPELPSDIKRMKWTRISDTRSILFVCCLDGTAHGLDVEHDGMLYSCRLKSSFTVWDSADRILVTKIIILRNHRGTDDVFSLVMSKGFHLVVSTFLLSGNVPVQPVLSHKFSAQITGMESISSKQVMCVLWNGATYLISINADSLSVESINKDISYTNYCCQGLTVSHNKVFAILFNSVSKSFDSFVLRQTAHYYVMLLPRQIADPVLKIESALKSGSVTVSSIVDYLAAFRFSVSTKERSLPENLIDQRSFSSLPDCSLQIYLQLTYTLKQTDCFESDKWTKLFNLIKTILYARFFTQKKCFNPVTIQWLRKVKSILGDNFAELVATYEQLLPPVENQEKAVCVICSSDVTDVCIDHYICSSKHKVPLCAFSFQPCFVIPYHVCDGCGAIALSEAVLSVMERCVLCDGTFQLDQTILESNVSDDNKGNTESHLEEEEITKNKKSRVEDGGEIGKSKTALIERESENECSELQQVR